MNGHRARVLKVDRTALATFASLYDGDSVPPAEARLPALHSRQLLTVAEKLATHPRRLADLQDSYHVTGHWHETAAQRQGTIERETHFPNGLDGLVFSGPHLSVGNPFGKPLERPVSRRRTTTALI